MAALERWQPTKRDSFANVIKANNDLDQTQGKKPDHLFDVAEIQDKTEHPR